jgi:hypothetical protein
MIVRFNIADVECKFDLKFLVAKNLLQNTTN